MAWRGVGDNACMHLTMDTNCLPDHVTFKLRVNWCGPSAPLTPVVPPKRSIVGHDLLGVERYRVNTVHCESHCLTPSPTPQNGVVGLLLKSGIHLLTMSLQKSSSFVTEVMYNLLAVPVYMTKSHCHTNNF